MHTHAHTHAHTHGHTHAHIDTQQKACENKEVIQKYRCTNDMCAAEFSSLDVDKLEMNFDA